MNIVVAIKHIPSIADDLPVKGNNVDFDSVDFVLNEFDEQSIEQAVLMKEAVGGMVTVIGVDLIGELDGVLHLALAKRCRLATKRLLIQPDHAPVIRQFALRNRLSVWNLPFLARFHRTQW